VPTLRPERVLAVKNGHEIVYSRQYLTGGRPVQAFDEARYGQKVYERVSVHGEDYDYRVDATGFWQAHQDAPKILLRTVLDTIGYIGTETVFDLYCGSGLFTGPIAAADAGQVWGVEGDFSAASNARYNTHRFKNVRILSGDVGRLLESDALPRRADVVVLDPPRVGAGRKVVDLIATRVPRRIVYVACDPAAMARDLGWIASLGYVLVKLRAFDLFPHTHHVECVAVLEMPQS
jgi:tRNA/tmRNA/rRNA uracil-C5-methylase (TrmA/RlmC/RlmD family)